MLDEHLVRFIDGSAAEHQLPIFGSDGNLACHKVDMVVPQGVDERREAAGHHKFQPDAS